MTQDTIVVSGLVIVVGTPGLDDAAVMPSDGV